MQHDVSSQIRAKVLWRIDFCVSDQQSTDFVFLSLQRSKTALRLAL